MGPPSIFFLGWARPKKLVDSFRDLGYYKTMKKTNQISGTHLQGVVDTSYDNLVKIFGEPHIKGEPGSKVDVEWAFEFKDGTISTIYNWKDGPCYQRDDGDPVETITDWHVGGMHKDALTKVAEKINRYPQYDSYTSKY